MLSLYRVVLCDFLVRDYRMHALTRARSAYQAGQPSEKRGACRFRSCANSLSNVCGVSTKGQVTSRTLGGESMEYLKWRSHKRCPGNIYMQPQWKHLGARVMSFVLIGIGCDASETRIAIKFVGGDIAVAD